MLLNLILLILLFGSEKKKKFPPYVMALIFGLIKGSAYGFYTGHLVIALVAGLIFAGMAAAFVFFMRSLNQSEDKDRPDLPTYHTPGSQKTKFRWQYIPLWIIAILLVGGEALSSFVTIVPSP